MRNNRYTYIAFLLFTVAVFSGCSSNSRSEKKESSVEDNTYEQMESSYDYTPTSETYTSTSTVQETPQID